MGNSIFSSNRHYLNSKPLSDFNTNDETLSEEKIKLYISGIVQKMGETKTNTSDTLVPILLKFAQCREEQKQECFSSFGFSMLEGLLPLLNDPDTDVQTCVYWVIQGLVDHLDNEELAEKMMDQLICLTWDYHDLDRCYELTRLFAVYVELFGKGLEKMTKARDWMLFLPFLANYMIKTTEIIEYILVNHSLFSPTSDAKDLSKWDDIITLLSHTFLDFIQFIHTKTVSQEPSEFPFESANIGLENSDIKRRYLGHSLLNTFYEKVISRFDLELAKTYFDEKNPLYKFRKPGETDFPKVGHFDDARYKPMFDIVHRAANLVSSSGITFEKLLQLKTIAVKNEEKDENKNSEDIAMENDRQMINARLYPISYDGVAILLCLSLYDKLIYPTVFHEASIGLLPDNLDYYRIAKEYIGLLLNLLRAPEEQSHMDKGLFPLFYLSDQIQTTYTSDDLENYIVSPYGDESGIHGEKIIEVISSAAVLCPDDSTRFLIFKLLDRFISFGDEQTQMFMILDLIERCPSCFLSMKTAAIGLMKDRVSVAIENYKTKKTLSVFASPLITEKIFSVIFQYNSTWETSSDQFWQEYNHIMQSLNLYYLVLSADCNSNITRVYAKDRLEVMEKSYMKPLTNALTNMKIAEDEPLQQMQISSMKHVIEKINQKIELHKGQHNN